MRTQPAPAAAGSAPTNLTPNGCAQRATNTTARVVPNSGAMKNSERSQRLVARMTRENPRTLRRAAVISYPSDLSSRAFVGASVIARGVAEIDVLGPKT